MKAGAADFVTKPWSNLQLVQAVETALGLAEARAGAAQDPAPDRQALDSRYELQALVGRDPRFLRVLELIGRVSGNGRLGSDHRGKRHGQGACGRGAAQEQPPGVRPFVKVNLGGISATLFESEMFGHVKGAFTDARADRKGRFELGNGGTIFLDEIGELDPSVQVKLLRVLQDRSYEVLGSSVTRTVDVRVVSATNRESCRDGRRGQFREDLLYRLNLITVHLPPLRERSRATSACSPRGSSQTVGGTLPP